jgi:plastocyanin
MHRLPVTLLACLTLAAGGLIAGCGDDDGDDAGSSAPPPAAAPPPPPPVASAKESADDVKITMKNIAYVPEAVTAKVNQRIVWQNTDGEIPHTVTASDGADFDSGRMTPGATFEYTPKKAGTIAYFCEIHPNQKGEITVVQ